MKFSWIVLLVLALGGAGVSQAAIKSEPLKFKAGTIQSQSILAYDDTTARKRPGIVIIPEWWGLNDYAKSRAKQLAQLGYVALAVDVYGDGKNTEKADEAGQWATALKAGDRAELRARVQAAVDQLKKNVHVDGANIAAIGYCFGGSAVLELARGGADIKGVVTFHGDLSIATPAQDGKVKAKVLVCHGGDDAFVTPAQVEAFQDEMRKAHVDWQMNVYGGAVHSFTNPGADKHGIPGIAYNKEADARSWTAMQAFLKEAFGK